MSTLVDVTLDEPTGVGHVTIDQPPNNYLDRTVLDAIVAAFRALDSDVACRAIVLSSVGKHFCAGRDFSKPRGPGDDSTSLYKVAGELLLLTKPWVAAVQGGAIGAGCGLALAADFRVCTDAAYFWPNFVKFGLHQGFGLTATLPRVVGQQRATRMLMTGDRISARNRDADGLADLVVPEPDLATSATAFAAHIAEFFAPATQSIRATMRSGLYEEFMAATEHEACEQARLTTLKSEETDS
jgi:enoyl-CoA hydratase/carnithine racemase